jgi:hypothetical protein
MSDDKKIKTIEDLSKEKLSPEIHASISKLELIIETKTTTLLRVKVTGKDIKLEMAWKKLLGISLGLGTLIFSLFKTFL